MSLIEDSGSAFAMGRRVSGPLFRAPQVRAFLYLSFMRDESLKDEFSQCCHKWASEWPQYCDAIETCWGITIKILGANIRREPLTVPPPSAPTWFIQTGCPTARNSGQAIDINYFQ